MSDDDANHLGPEESVKRDNTERLQADVADLVFFLLSMAGPPDLPGVIYDSIMALATEALEHASQRKEHQPADEAVLVYEFKRPVDLTFEDQLQAGFDDAVLSVEQAARQLARAEPNTEVWRRANWVLRQAINQLIAASAGLMRLDPEIRAAQIRAAHIRAVRIEAHRDEHATSVGVTEAVDPTPFGELDALATDKAWRELEELFETGHQQAHSPVPNPVSQPGIAPGPSY